MSLVAARLPLVPEAPARAPRARVWRPFPREVADIIGVEACDGAVQPRMYPWFGISLVRSPAVVTVEARRDGRNHGETTAGGQIDKARQQLSRCRASLPLLGSNRRPPEVNQDSPDPEEPL